MHRINATRGRHQPCEEPVWEPLMDLVGPVLIGWFMWMGEIRLDTGRSVHAYKHCATRRYLHLADGETAFMFIAPNHYTPIRLESALAEAFLDWDVLSPDPSDEDRAALLAVRHRLRYARAIDV